MLIQKLLYKLKSIMVQKIDENIVLSQFALKNSKLLPNLNFKWCNHHVGYSIQVKFVILSAIYNPEWSYCDVHFNDDVVAEKNSNNKVT